MVECVDNALTFNKKEKVKVSEPQTISWSLLDKEGAGD
jgi:hypothetical protein